MKAVGQVDGAAHELAMEIGMFRCAGEAGSGENRLLVLIMLNGIAGQRCPVSIAARIPLAWLISARC
jgi:hypothetical protein